MFCILRNIPHPAAILGNFQNQRKYVCTYWRLLSWFPTGN